MTAYMSKLNVPGILYAITTTKILVQINTFFMRKYNNNRLCWQEIKISELNNKALNNEWIQNLVSQRRIHSNMSKEIRLD